MKVNLCKLTNLNLLVISNYVFQHLLNLSKSISPLQALLCLLKKDKNLLISSKRRRMEEPLFSSEIRL